MSALHWFDLVLLATKVFAGAADITFVCREIEKVITPSSAVFWPGQEEYNKDIFHWAESSAQPSTCSVQPGTTEDVGKILRIIKENPVPFAAKGGGHATNPSFSSTVGIQISMTRFSQITYEVTTQTATVGSGTTWGDVYAAVAEHGVSVVGGRVPSVGVAGLALGGGYGWKSNQFGLAVDNIIAYELVKPDGKVVNVTSTSHPELDFGLKGGLNNFGIVTRFTLKTHAQGQVFGGVINYPSSATPAVLDAVAKFAATVLDTKAALIAPCISLNGTVFLSVTLFYDGPSAPPRMFDDLLALPHDTADVKTREFVDFVVSAAGPDTPGFRNSFETHPVRQYSRNFLNAILNETTFWGSQLPASTLSYVIEPMVPNAFAQGDAPTAYPAASVRKAVFQPSAISFAWALGRSDLDNLFHNSLRKSGHQLTAAALADGQDVRNHVLYLNYALFGTPLEKLYGENLPRLRALKHKVDPGNIMGLAGGFKLL